MYLSIVSIISYVITKISVTIFAGAIVFETLLGIDFWTGAIIVVIVTGLYTVIGGLKAVIYTDTIQMFLLLGGSILVTVFGLDAIGGWNNMVAASAGSVAVLESRRHFLGSDPSHLDDEKWRCLAYDP